MRFRTMLMLTAAVSIAAILGLGCPVESLYAQSQTQAQTPAQSQGQPQVQAPAQGQSQGQVNDRVRELQEQYKNLLKHEYNPSQYHPAATEQPSFSKPGWLNHSRPKVSKRASRSRAGRRTYGKTSSKWRKTRGRKAATHRYAKTRRRGHTAASKKRHVRSRRLATHGAHKNLRRVSSKRGVSRRRVEHKKSAVRKSRPSRAASRHRGRIVRVSAKKAMKGHRPSKARHVRKPLLKKGRGRKKARRSPAKFHHKEKKHKK
ncbi:MAG: hypothetical protein ACP5SH_10730 [Syntrophobacteraceae bacterium]